MEHYSVVRLAQKAVKKKRKINVVSSTWKMRDNGMSSDDDNDNDQISYIAAATDNATYARSLGFPEPFPEFVSHLEEPIVQERLNRSLPVSLWAHLFQPLLKLVRVNESI